MSKITPHQYQQFVIDIKEKIKSAQYQALKKVNQELIKLYWEIGEIIVKKQEELGWGKSVVEKLSKDIQQEFPKISGFSATNLWRMRYFFQSYPDYKNLPPMVGEIGWSHNILILEKCKDELQRTFYIKMTKKFGWTKNVLIHQIENQSYEKFLLNQTNFDKTLPEKYRNQAKLAVKDEYTFDFLELSEEHSEYQLEQALVKNIRAFLIEMGGDYSFIGNQYRLEVGTKEYFIDLLLFHRKLQSLIAIDLKIGEFKPEYKGKMEFYLTALNEQVKMPHENESIGILICKSKDELVVEYALKSAAHPIGIASYTVSPKLPKNYFGLLPSEKEIKDVLEKIDLFKN